MTTSSNAPQPTADALYNASRKRRHGTRFRRNADNDITYLNITPMLDMMTILLVFLIKSFSASASNVDVANLTLPHSTTKLKVEEAITLIVNKDTLVLDHKPITKMNNGEPLIEDLPEGPNGYLIKPLYDALVARADYFKQIEQYGGTPFKGQVAVIADKSMSYKTLFKILYTVGRAEFGLFRLFVQKAPD